MGAVVLSELKTLTSNLLCLNSSKTEFLLVGLQSQLNKIQNPTLHLNIGISLPPTASARNLGFMFTLTSPSLIRFLLYLGHVSMIFVISAESVQFSISVQHMP